jgi:hypothetical protein
MTTAALCPVDSAKDFHRSLSYNGCLITVKIRYFSRALTFTQLALFSAALLFLSSKISMRRIEFVRLSNTGGPIPKTIV